MEENKKESLFSRVVNSKGSVVLLIITMAIFYFGSMIGGVIIARMVLPLEDLFAMAGELSQNEFALFVFLMTIAIVSLFSVLPVIGIFVSFLPCLIATVTMWIVYIIWVAITGVGKTKELIKE